MPFLSLYNSFISPLPFLLSLFISLHTQPKYYPPLPLQTNILFLFFVHFFFFIYFIYFFLSRNHTHHHPHQIRDPLGLHHTNHTTIAFHKPIAHLTSNHKTICDPIAGQPLSTDLTDREREEVQNIRDVDLERRSSIKPRQQW